jgi:hypothetical protein
MKISLMPAVSLLSIIALISAFTSATRTPRVIHAEAQTGLDPQCTLPSDWLPETPPPNEVEVPLPEPHTDCAFYRPAWQRFMIATQPMDSTGKPMFLSYPSFEDVFFDPKGASRKNKLLHPDALNLILIPRNVERANDPSDTHQQLLDITQAAIGNQTGGALIDQNGHFIYYAIHVDPYMESFLRLYNLTTPDGISRSGDSLAFQNLQSPFLHSVVEFKSAWMIVDNEKAAPNYYVVQAEVPRYVVGHDGKLTQDRRLDGQLITRPVWVALIALHVAFTLPGHPEMIWSTFEHVHLNADGSGDRDNAPAAVSNPPAAGTQTIAETSHRYPLFKSHTPANLANLAITDPKQMAAQWDTKGQVFKRNGSIVQTSVYRPYPASKSDGAQPEDDEVLGINASASKLFSDPNAHVARGDKRRNYRLVGATWLDRPDQTFAKGKAFDGPIVAGEDRLGSTSMESFTESPNSAPNCFSCHDTRKIVLNGSALPPKTLNVSHLLSRYLIQSSRSTKTQH